MTITKKHLKELADIVYNLSIKGEQDGANAVEGFARRHAPNFSQSHWDSYMHRQRVGKPEPNKQYRLVGKSGESSIARGNTWAESEIK